MNDVEAIKIIEYAQKRLQGGGRHNEARMLDILSAALAINRLDSLRIVMSLWYIENYKPIEAKEKKE